MRTKKMGIFMAGLSAMMLASVAFASHPGGNVTLRDSGGDPITNGTTPYSPKATCGGCHNYGSGDKFSTHVQGVLESDNKVYWQAYKTKSFEHGVSVGRHSNQGRDEDYSNAQRAAYGDPFFTSSPGMFGKY